MARKSIMERLQGMPMWKHCLGIILVVALWRILRAFSLLAALVLLILVVGPLWFVPLPGGGS